MYYDNFLIIYASSVTAFTRPTIAATSTPAAYKIGLLYSGLHCFWRHGRTAHNNNIILNGFVLSMATDRVYGSYRARIILCARHVGPFVSRPRRTAVPPLADRFYFFLGYFFCFNNSPKRA